MSFQCFVAPEGRKVGSLKRPVRSHLGRWEMKNCIPLWREASQKANGAILPVEVEMLKKPTPTWREVHFETKMWKIPWVWSTFGSWDVEKVHGVVAGSTFPSQNGKNTPRPRSDYFWTFKRRFSWQGKWIPHLLKREGDAPRPCNFHINHYFWQSPYIMSFKTCSHCCRLYRMTCHIMYVYFCSSP